MHHLIKKAMFVLLLFLPLSAFAIFPILPQVSYVPLDRLIANTKAYLKNHPNDHQAIYTFARIHYLAFVNKYNLVCVMDAGNKTRSPDVAPDFILDDFMKASRSLEAERIILKERGLNSKAFLTEEDKKKFYNLCEKKEKELLDQKWEPEKISQEELLKHVQEAILNFNKAIKIEPNNGLDYLGLASLYKQYLIYKKTANLKDEPTELKEINLELTRTLFYKAYSLTIEADLKLKIKPMYGSEHLVSVEAGTAYLDLTKEYAMKEDKKISKDISESISKINALENGPVTPIIFTFEKHNSILELLDSKVNVNFDLDGDGKAEMLPWLKNTTGLLVWDPQGTGKITSGRQLFGSVTWWIFFQNGYHALDMLDDNRDGQLSGDELIGISCWFDKNGNGISDLGEVVSLQSLGIQSIGTKPTSETSGMPMHSEGITLNNGTKIPTYDWIASPTKKSIK